MVRLKEILVEVVLQNTKSIEVLSRMLDKAALGGYLKGYNAAVGVQGQFQCLTCCLWKTP